MFKLPENYVVTYDTSFLQHHTDSTDFEDYCTENGTLILKNNQGNHNLVEQTKRRTKKKNHTRNDATNLYIDCDEYPVKLKKETDTPNSKEIVTTTEKKSGKKHKTKKRKQSDMNKGDMLPVKSKLSIITHKLMPRISSLFKRMNYSTKANMAVIEEKRDENMCIDNRYQHCMNCGERRTRKLFGPRDFVIRPVYTIEGNAHKPHTVGPFIPTKLPEQVYNIKTKNQYSSYCSHSSSSESETQLARDRHKKVEMFRKRLKAEIRKEHIKYQQNQMCCTQQVQFPSKNSMYNTIFSTSPVQTQTNYSGLYINDKLPSSSSSFWNYLFEKSYMCGRKYQTQRMEVQPEQQLQKKEACFCTPSKQNMMGTCCFGKKNQMLQEECACKKKNQPIEERRCNAMCSATKFNNKPPINQQDNQTPSTTTLPPTLPKKPSPKQEKKKKKQKNKVECLCHEAEKPNAEKLDEKQSPEQFKPCQENHDEVTANLSQKYNGQILCIHNPPCILINGCLNLPGPKDDAQNDLSFWPVTETKRDIFGHNTAKALREQSCQYHVEIQNEQATDFKVEKKIQSICHHRPPCEVVRECYKAKYDPQLENSCCHVPMCKKVPECMIGSRNKENCDHRPKCRDIPICSRDFVILTAKENIATQVTRMNPSNAPKKEPLVCRHEPPCILIPKCIGRAMCDCTFVNLDAIPGCIHEPMCELIPACCRKSMKEMVSVSSQYPNSCRIS